MLKNASMSANAWFRKPANSGAQWLHPILLKTMKSIPTKPWTSLLLTMLMLSAFSVASYSSAEKKKPKAYRDINAIGHRVIGYQSGLGNWFSLDKEEQIGTHLSADYEISTPLIHDGATQEYLDRLAQTISQNSDTQFPITTR